MLRLLILLVLSASWLPGVSEGYTLNFWNASRCIPLYSANGTLSCDPAFPREFEFGSFSEDDGITSILLDGGFSFGLYEVSASATAVSGVGVIPPGHTGPILIPHAVQANGTFTRETYLTVNSPAPTGYLEFNLFVQQSPGSLPESRFKAAFIGANFDFVGERHVSVNVPFTSGQELFIYYGAGASAFDTAPGVPGTGDISGSARIVIESVRVLDANFNQQYGFTSSGGPFPFVVVPEPAYSAGILIAIAAMVTTRKLRFKTQRQTR